MNYIETAASLMLELSLSTLLTQKLADRISNLMSMSGFLISNGIYLARVLGSSFKTRLKHVLHATRKSSNALGFNLHKGHP